MNREPIGDIKCAYRLEVNPEKDFQLFPWGKCSDSTQTAVIWDKNGRGACGAHIRPLEQGLKP